MEHRALPLLCLSAAALMKKRSRVAAQSAMPALFSAAKTAC